MKFFKNLLWFLNVKNSEKILEKFFKNSGKIKNWFIDPNKIYILILMSLNSIFIYFGISLIK